MTDPRRHIVDAALEALRHTVGRDQHMPHFLDLVHEGAASFPPARADNPVRPVSYSAKADDR